MNTKHVEKIKNIYLTLLHRNADEDGLNTYVQVLETGKSIDYVENCIKKSKEYKQIQNTYHFDASKLTCDPNAKLIMCDLAMSRKGTNTPILKNIVFHLYNIKNDIQWLYYYFQKNYDIMCVHLYSLIPLNIQKMNNVEFHLYSFDYKEINDNVNVVLNLDFVQNDKFVLHNLWDLCSQPDLTKGVYDLSNMYFENIKCVPLHNDSSLLIIY